MITGLYINSNVTVRLETSMTFHYIPYSYLSDILSSSHSLTVSQINDYLDQLALSNLKKDRPGVKKAIQILLRNTSAQEQKWLIRIIMKVCIHDIIIIISQK